MMTNAGDSQGLFIVGGVVKSRITNDDQQVLQDYLSSLLQVHNLVILIGSGASFHLGSPHTRGLDTDAVKDLIASAGSTVEPADEDLLRVLNPNDDGDLEKLLNGLQLAVALASQMTLDRITLGEGSTAQSFSVNDIEGLRKKIGAALAFACRLPGEPGSIDPDYREDPLRAHRDFISRVVRNRRANLPRPRIFTTNYDLVIESALDQLGYPYIDGFSGTVDRRLNLSYYGLDFHRVDTTSQQALARAESALYLHKIHGSLNWKAAIEIEPTTGVESLEVHQVAENAASQGERVLIYPTTAKEGDTLAYPYSDLMRMLGDAVQQDNTAIISVGYGFADPHINRILLRSLAMNPELNVFVADPYAVLEDNDMTTAAASKDLVDTTLSEAGFTPKSTAIAALAASTDARVAVLTGDSGKFTEFANLMPDPGLGSGQTSPSAVVGLIESLEATLARPASTTDNDDD
ncbi:SIR2 family protein [Corynebacterium sanguinis]|uniref:SIR2 family protein n=1 Tax=Corynebacterium sanguinis TaxID=2594913 RepID=UPI00223B4BE5|nr:SIR2 family protein [Corynebacterium sanguinis]MCT1665132.1 SIR2 family protein [Corynebacterium sanguinis]